MIRSLAPDELAWFLSQSFQFLGHGDAKALAAKTASYLKDLELEADKAFILIDGGEPLAGVYVDAPERDEDDQNLRLSNLWFKRSPADTETLLRQVFARHKYEAVQFPLYNMPAAKADLLQPIFEGLGFSFEGACDLDFELSDLPPLGIPLVLEAWTYQTDDAFQTLYDSAESTHISDEHWAWLKRLKGKFSPDLWFIARETLDQDAVGYAFYGAEKEGIDGVYYLTAAGVLPEHRHSSEMLRRLILSSLHELASMSPLGRVETTISSADPKLIQIFELLGFDSLHRYKQFIKRPV